MAVGAAFRDHIADLFAPFGDLAFKRFFGGVGLYHKGKLFGFIMRDRIYLKTDETTRSAYQAESAEPFTFTNGKGEIVEIAYFELPARLHDELDELGEWVRRAHNVALTTRSAEKKPARKGAMPAELPLIAPSKIKRAKKK